MSNYPNEVLPKKNHPNEDLMDNDYKVKVTISILKKKIMVTTEYQQQQQKNQGTICEISLY